MKYTNRLDLPASLVRAVERDDYSKGNADFSVTELIGPPRIHVLAKLNAAEMTTDIADRIASLLGRAFHKVAEFGAEDDEIVEERFFAKIEDRTISGAADLQKPLSNGTWFIRDFKVTSVYSATSEKPEWEKQLNMYAWLAWATKGRLASRLQVIAIMKDWQRKKAQMDPFYPQVSVITVEIPVWNLQQTEEFIRSRVILHKHAHGFLDTGVPLPYCTPEERWLRGEQWAIMKPNSKRALKLYDNEAEARANCPADCWIEHRPGDPIRCRGDYCNVSRWCKQWLDECAAQGAVHA